MWWCFYFDIGRGNLSHKVSLIFLLILSLPISARAATCSAGNYLNNGTCTPCLTQAFYCPGDDTRHPCPTTDTDYSDLSGYRDVTREYALYVFGSSVPTTGEWTWTAGSGSGAQSAYSCRGRILYMNDDGNAFFTESSWNGTNYYSSGAITSGMASFWFYAADGYYLSRWTQVWSRANLYHAVKACTNAPTNAHYTGPGTPDSQDGTIVNANDCPWECDAGYGRHGNECLPLCTAGITQLKTSTGISLNVYLNKTSTPAINIGYNNTVCYVNLEPGAGGLSFRYNNTVYHATD